MNVAPVFQPLVFLGFGSVAQCLIPLLQKYYGLSSSFITVIEPRTEISNLTRLVDSGARWIQERVTRDNYGAVLDRWVPDGSFLVDLSVGVETKALLMWCRNHHVLYVNASVELWDPPVDLSRVPPQDRTLYPRHEALQSWRRTPGVSTALVDHGVNPGLVSHFVKAALVDLAVALGHPGVDGQGFGVLARDLGVKVIHIAEKDSQILNRPRHPDEFLNTWSVDGFIEEALAPAEMGWGTHESRLPEDALVHPSGPQHQICLTRPGCKTKVRTWVPSGPTVGMVIRHGEAYTITEHLTVRENNQVVYRPTVHYAYRASDVARASLDDLEATGWRLPLQRTVVTSEVVSGTDELGVLLMGHDLRGWWFGSELSYSEAETLVPGQNATTVQVAAGLAASILWILKNPRAGLLVPDDLPWDEVLSTARPFLGKLSSRPVSWGPLDAPLTDLFAEWHPDGKGQDNQREWDFESFRIP